MLGIDAELAPAVGAADEEPAADETLPCGDRELAAGGAAPVIEGVQLGHASREMIVSPRQFGERHAALVADDETGSFT